MSTNLENLKSKIVATGKITADELNVKIKQKMDSLSGLISEEGALHIIANEYKVQTQMQEPKKRRTIKELASGDRNVEIAAEVQRIYDIRTFMRDGQEGKVASILVSDNSGMIRIVFWHEKTDVVAQLKEKDIILVQNAYVRQNQDRLEMHLNDSSDVKVNPTGVIVENAKQVGMGSQTQSVSYTRKKIADVPSDEMGVEILGTVVQLYDVRFFATDPSTQKTVREAEREAMSEEEQAKLQYRSVLNIFVDDGSDNIQCVVWQDQIKQLCGIDDAKLDEIRKNPSLFDEYKNGLLGEIIVLQGNIKMNTMFNRREFVARNIVKNPDPKKEIDTLQNDLAKAKDEVVKDVDTSKGFESADSVSNSDDKLEKINEINKKLAEEIKNIEDLDEM